MADNELELDIIDQLDFEPSVNAADIGVVVEDAVVTLSGHVASYREKMIASEIVENVRGVRAVENGITVRPPGGGIASDAEIADRVARVLDWHAAIPAGRLHATVQDGRVTLQGEVEWRYQSETAKKAVGRLAGVIEVIDRIRVKPSVNAAAVAERIRKALLRDAELDASAIHVEVEDGTVTLSGKVRYLGERKCAERAAWAMPGVTNVVDRLSVR